MKKEKIQIILSFTIYVVFTLFFGCKDKEEVPLISQVRLVAKNEVITEGEFGLFVAIQGSGLGQVIKVKFNDLEAELNPNMITDNNIICSIPDKAPNEINNKITVITSSGISAEFEFKVKLPKPIIQGMKNEFLKDGEVGEILGEYFYFVKSVKLGNTTLEILESTPNSVKVKMPAIVTKDRLYLESEGGIDTSAFRINETEGNMINFDIPATSWGSPVCWGGAPIIDGSDADALSGKFSRIYEQNLAVTGWQDSWVLSTCYFEFNINSGNPAKKMFKFEHKVDVPWKSGQYQIILNGSYVYKFSPWTDKTAYPNGYTTTGWQTVYIPLTEFKNGNSSLSNNTAFLDLQVYFQNVDINEENKAVAISEFKVSLDNFRVVDIKKVD